MPTLPGQADSILAALAEFATPPSRDTPTFDWTAIVQRDRPGSATERQRAQAARMAVIQTRLREWLAEQHLAPIHLEESAFYATVALSESASPAQELSLGELIAWIYAIDDFVDTPARWQGARNDPSLALDGALTLILQPLRLLRRMRHPRHAPHARRRFRPMQGIPEVVALRDSLRAALATMRAAWRPLAGSRGVASFRDYLIARELTACVTMMRQEFRWNRALAASPDGAGLPDVATYLRTGAISIGMYAVAALAACFERAPRQAWRLGAPAIESGGRVIRLTNDIHTYEADALEEKATIVTLMLRDLGAPLTGLDPTSSASVHLAQEQACSHLKVALVDFARASGDLPEGPLAYAIGHAVAFALAVYGSGSGHSAAQPTVAPEG